MDNSNNRPRDMVYCHECENEWYRDEHGLACPSCHSDFTEIIEAANDPRSDNAALSPPPDHRHPGDHGDFHVPDPDEDDIDNFQWERTGPDRIRIRGTYRTDIPIGPNAQQQQQQPQGQMQGGLMGLVGNVLQNMLGGQQGTQQQAQPQPGREQSPWQQGPWLGVGSPTGTPRPASAPGSPQPGPTGHGGTFVRGHGPGYMYTITTSSNANVGGNLFPRNANAPQAFQPQPDHIEQIVTQMFANIGAMQGGEGGGMRMGGGLRRGVNPFNGDDGFVDGPFIIDARQGGQMRGLNLANLFQLFGPPGGVAGDAVYSQEALDRIITQLMEQHQTGNAPGPATEAAIKALPTKIIGDADQADSGKAECSICMDEAALGSTVTLLPCQHWFHAECIRAWLSEHDTCPHCRQGIMPKDGDANASRPRQPDQEPMHDMRSPDYTRSSIPGGFPFPRQNSAGSASGMTPGGDGSRPNPYTIPDSPTLNRRNSSGLDRRSSGNGGGSGSGSGGMFSRMRGAFGGGSSGSR